MNDFIMMAALGAVLSYGAVSAYNQPVLKLEKAVAGQHGDRIPAKADKAETWAAPSATGSVEAGRLVTAAIGKSDDTVRPAGVQPISTSQH